MDALMGDVWWYSVHSTNRIDHYLKKIGYEIQLRNQPLNSLVFIMYQ